MKVTIKDIAYYFPEQLVTNEDLSRENPHWDMHAIEERVGVTKRYVAAEGETALDLSLKACDKLFSRHKDIAKKIDGIIFCTQSGDYIMPPNACILHKMLGLSEDVLAFDFNLACSGYIYGLALAKSLICSDMARNILLVNADTYSKYIAKNDRSVRVLFGDAAAVSWITSSQTNAGIIDIRCYTSGEHYDKFIIPAGGCRMPKTTDTGLFKTDNSGNQRSADNIYMDGMEILVFVNSKIPGQVKQILLHNNLTVDDVDLFIFHQASKVALDSLMNLLKITPKKVYRNLAEIGNVVSASIPIAFKDATEKGLISAGSTVVLCGFGAGLSWGTVVIKM